MRPVDRGGRLKRLVPPSPELAWLDAQQPDYGIDPKLRASIEKVQELNRKRFKDSVALYGSTAAEMLGELGRLGGRGLEETIDFGLKKIDSIPDAALRELGYTINTPSHQAFRWNNFDTFKTLSSTKWAAEQYGANPQLIFDRHPILKLADEVIGRHMPGADSTIRASMMAGLFGGLEARTGHTWVRDNPELARNQSLEIMDPFILATPFTKAYEGAKAGANISALEARVPALYNLAKDGAAALTSGAMDLYGWDTSQKAFHGLVSAYQKAGVSAREMATTLHAIGIRAPEVPIALRDLSPNYRGILFKQPATLISPTGNQMLDALGEGINKAAVALQKSGQGVGRLFLDNHAMYDTRFGEIVHEKVKALEHLSDSQRNAMNVLGKIPERLAQPVHDILKSVERIAPEILDDGTKDVSRTVASFRSNYTQMVKEGKIVHNPKAYDFAERAVGLMASGWDPTVNWWTKLSVNPEFAKTGQLEFKNILRPLARPWDNPNIGHAETVTGNMMGNFVVKVATREERVATMNGLISHADELSTKLQTMRTRFTKLADFASKDPEIMRTGAGRIEDVQDYSKMRKIQDLLDMGFSTAGERIPSVTELMTERKDLTGKLNVMRQEMKDFNARNLPKLGNKGAGRETYARMSEIVDAEKRITEIDRLRKSAGAKATDVPSDFDQVLEAVTRGDKNADYASMRQLAEDVGLGEAVRSGRGQQWVDSLNDYTRTGIKTAKRTVADLRRFRGTEDPIDALGKLGMSEADLAQGGRNLFGRIMGGYSQGLGAIRTAQIMNPATMLANGFDTAVGTPLIQRGSVDLQTISRSIATGKPVELYTWLGEPVSKYADNQIAALAKDIMPGGTSWYSKVAQKASEGMTIGENIGRRGVWWDIYNKGMTELTKGGTLAMEAADKVMTTIATKKTDELLVNYNNLSPAEKMGRYIAYYPIFNSQYAMNYAKLFMGHGTETVAATRALSEYYKGSTDGTGNYEVYGGLMLDPASSVSAASSLLKVADAAHAITDPDTRAGIAVMKSANAWFGNVAAPVQALLSKTGAVPDFPQAGLSKYDNFIANAMGYFTGKPYSPGDIAQNAMGMRATDARQTRAFKVARQVAIASARNGEIITPEQALNKAYSTMAISAAASLFLPKGSYKGPIIDVVRDQADAQKLIDDAPEAHKDSMRQVILKEKPDLAPLLQDTPAIRARKLSRSLGIEAGASAVAAADHPSLIQRIEGLFSGGNSGGKSGGESGGPPPENFSVATSTGTPDNTLSQQRAREPILSAVAAVGKTVDGWLTVSAPDMSKFSSAEAATFLNVQMKNDLRQRMTAEKQHDYVATLSPNAQALVRFAAEQDPFYAGVWHSFRTVEAGPDKFSEEYFKDATPEVAKARGAFQKYFQSEVFAAGPRAEQMASQPLEFWRAKMVQDKEKLLGFGIKDAKSAEGFLDQASLSLAKSSLPEGYGEKADYISMRQKLDRYPEMGYWIGQLQDATRNPKKASNTVAAVNQAKADGKLPEDFWPLIKDSKVNGVRNLYQNVGVAASFDEAKMTMDRLITHGPDGRMTGINHAALFEIASNPNMEPLRQQVSAIRAGYYGPDAARAVNQAIDALPPNIQEPIDSRFPINAEATQAHFEGVTDLQGKNYSTSFGSILQAVLPPPPAPAVPKVAAPAPGAPAAQTPSILQPQSPQQFIQSITTPEPKPANFVQLSPRPMPTATTLAASLPPPERSSWFGQPVWADNRLSSVSGIIRQSISDHNQQVAYANSTGHPELAPSFMTTFGKNVNTAMQSNKPALVTSGLNAAQAGLSLANTFDLLPQSGDGAAAIAGFTTGVSTMMMLGGPGNPLAIGAGVAAGIFTGLKGGGSRGNNEEMMRIQRENLRINQERLDLQNKQFAESLAQQSIRDLSSRERLIAGSVGGKPGQFGPNVQSRVAQFQRRGTYASKVGLIDSIERELSSSLRPRF